MRRRDKKVAPTQGRSKNQNFKTYKQNQHKERQQIKSNIGKWNHSRQNENKCTLKKDFKVNMFRVIK